MAVSVDRKAGGGVLAAACVSAFVVNANTSAVTILLPSISEDLGAPVAQLQWAVTGYSLVGAAVIVTSGALGDVLGRRKVFLGGLALFIGSCVLIALSQGAAGVIGGRMIQGASGATILACGMSLLSVAASGAAQMKAVTLWGAASAAGGAAGPLVGGVLVDVTGWQGLFWIDAGIAALCVPLTIRTVQESRDPNRSRSIDWTGTVLVALVLAPVILALSKGNDWGWASAATLGCFAISIVSLILFVSVERRVEAPLVDLQLLRNRVLVGATLAILLVAGTINALMYVLSLYFQNPDAFGMSALEAGLATLPAAAAMIAITPAITPLAGKIGGGRAVALGFLLATIGFAVLAFAQASWEYIAFVGPMIVLVRRPRHLKRARVVGLDGVRRARAGRRGVGDLEHGALRRRRRRRRGDRDDQQRRRQQPQGGRRDHRAGAGGRSRRLGTGDGDLVRRRHPADRAHAAPAHQAHAGGRPRRRGDCHLLHDSDRPHAAPAAQARPEGGRLSSTQPGLRPAAWIARRSRPSRRG